MFALSQPNSKTSRVTREKDVRFKVSQCGLRSDTENAIAAMTGVWCRYCIRRSEPDLLILYIPFCTVRYDVILKWKMQTIKFRFNCYIEESLKELAQLVDTAGLMVVDSTYQKLSNPNPKTYIGSRSGKLAEIKTAINGYGVETVIFDDEISAGYVFPGCIGADGVPITKIKKNVDAS
nr:GTP-binding protein, HflX [Tanacetum cinerariifolium]